MYEHLKYNIATKSEALIKSLLTKKSPGQDGYTD